jgi:hypothetical protein
VDGADHRPAPVEAHDPNTDVLTQQRRQKRKCGDRDEQGEHEGKNGTDTGVPSHGETTDRAGDERRDEHGARSGGPLAECGGWRPVPLADVADAIYRSERQGDQRQRHQGEQKSERGGAYPMNDPTLACRPALAIEGRAGPAVDGCLCARVGSPRPQRNDHYDCE